MFRQKIIQVTDCSCRLIPEGKGDFKIFKTLQAVQKPKSKQFKQKYSLKNKVHTTSSQKHQNTKINSANKINQKYQKNTQISTSNISNLITQKSNNINPHKITHLTTKNDEQKISISGNLDSKKKKTNQKMTVCSPSQSNIRKINEDNLITSNITEIDLKINEFAKTTQADRNNINNNKPNRIVRNSHKQLPLQTYMARQQKVLVSNFMNQNSSNHYMSQPSENNIKFQQYYKLISNPYTIRDKQNVGVKLVIVESGQKVLNNMKKVDKYKNQIVYKKNGSSIINNKQINSNVNNIRQQQQYMNLNNNEQFHQSLQKYDKTKNRVKERQSRGTFNQYNQGYLINLQKDFIVNELPKVASVGQSACGNLVSNNYVSVNNLKNQNTQKIKCNNTKKYVHQNVSNKQESDDKINNQLLKNKSEVYVAYVNNNERNYVCEVNKDKNIKKQYNNELNKDKNIKDYSIDKLNKNKNNKNDRNYQDYQYNIKTQNSLQDSNQEQDLKVWVNQMTDLFNKNTLQHQKNIKYYTNNVNIQNDHSNPYNNNQNLKNYQNPLNHQNHQNNNNKMLIQKMSTFNDIISNKQQCESLLDESNQTDQSIVIMRYKDFLQKSENQTNTHNYNTKTNSILKQNTQNYNMSTNSIIKPNICNYNTTTNSILKPLNLDNVKNFQHTKNKISSLTVSTKADVHYDTNVKKHNKKQNNIVNENDYMFGVNNLKKTVKMPKQYSINHFNSIQ